MTNDEIFSALLLWPAILNICSSSPCNNLRSDLVACECGRDFVLKRCTIASSCYLEIDDYKINSIADNFEISTQNCASNIVMILQNLKVESLRGLTNALKKQEIQNLGIGSIKIERCSNLQVQSIEDMSDLTKNGGSLVLWKNLAGTHEQLNLTRLSQSQKRLKLDKNYASVKSGGFIDLDSIQQELVIEKTVFEDAKIEIFFNGKNNAKNKTVKWVNNNLMPRFLETTEKSEPLSIILNGSSQFLRKEVIMNVDSNSVTSIDFSYYNRIEYGTISNGKEFRFIKLEIKEQKLFNSGLCTQITDSDACELCLIHQYALRRNENSVEKTCRDKVPITNHVQKCYWSHPEPIPCSLRSFDIFDSWIDKSVPVCTNIPEDIQRYLDSISSGKSLDIWSSTF